MGDQLLYPQWEDQKKVKGFRMENVSLLAAPKGVKYLCELSGDVATIALVTPWMTLYYTTKQQAFVSWEGIMHKVVPSLAPLREKRAIVGSEEQRAVQEAEERSEKKRIIDLAMGIAKTYLVHEQFELALPGAVLSIKCAEELYGKNGIEMVPIYLILAQINLGRGNIASSREFIGIASWIMIQNPNISNMNKSLLEATQGKMAVKEGKHQNAATFFAKEVYWASIEYGPEHIESSPGYFHLGTVFDAQGRTDTSLLVYDKVVDIWYTYLSHQSDVAGENLKTLENAQLELTKTMLLHISAIRQRCLGTNHIAFGEVEYTLGVLRVLLGQELDLAKENLLACKTIFEAHLGGKHSAMKRVDEMLQNL